MFNPMIALDHTVIQVLPIHVQVHPIKVELKESDFFIIKPVHKKQNHMDKQYLFENEILISESGDKSVTLTTHRLRHNSSSTGSGHIVSIMLEKISSIEIHYKSWILILFIGILLACGGLIMGAQNRGDVMILGLGAGGLCILLFFLTRKHIVTIASDGGAKINFQTKGMKRDMLLDFINKIETAKAIRLK